LQFLTLKGLAVNDTNRLKVKNSLIVSIIGVSLTIFGVCGLFVLALFNSRVFRRADFNSINGDNIFLVLLVSVIICGFIVELVGRYKLGKTLNDMRLLYNKLNSYFALSLFVVFAMKELLNRNGYFFFVKFNVSATSFDSPGGVFGYVVLMNFIFSAFAALIYYLFRDYKVLSKTFDAKFPMIVFIVVCLSAVLTPFGIYVFIPYLIMQIVAYIRLFNVNPIDKLNQSKGKILNLIEKIFLLIATVVIIIIFIQLTYTARIVNMRLLLVIICMTPLLPAAIVFSVISLLQKYNQTILSLITMTLLSATCYYFTLFWRPN
jgi:hypothetical protein